MPLEYADGDPPGIPRVVRPRALALPPGPSVPLERGLASQGVSAALPALGRAVSPRAGPGRRRGGRRRAPLPAHRARRGTPARGLAAAGAGTGTRRAPARVGRAGAGRT